MDITKIYQEGVTPKGTTQQCNSHKNRKYLLIRFPQKGKIHHTIVKIIKDNVVNSVRNKEKDPGSHELHPLSYQQSGNDGQDIAETV